MFHQQKWQKHMTTREPWQVKWGPEIFSFDTVPSWSCTVVFVFCCGNPKWPFWWNICWWARQHQVNESVKTVKCNLECSLTPFSFTNESCPRTTFYMHNEVQRLFQTIFSKGDPVGNQRKCKKTSKTSQVSEGWSCKLSLTTLAMFFEVHLSYFLNHH